MCINVNPSALITVNNAPLEYVEEFTYLGIPVNKDNAAPKDIRARHRTARSTFARLQSIWKSKEYSLTTLVRLYSSSVKPVLLYGSECCHVVKGDMIAAFNTGCLKKICRIFWPKRISNEALYKNTKSQSVVLEIKCRRLRWLG